MVKHTGVVHRTGRVHHVGNRHGHGHGGYSGRLGYLGGRHHHYRNTYGNGIMNCIYICIGACVVTCIAIVICFIIPIALIVSGTNQLGTLGSRNIKIDQFNDEVDAWESSGQRSDFESMADTNGYMQTDYNANVDIGNFVKDTSSAYNIPSLRKPEDEPEIKDYTSVTLRASVSMGDLNYDTTSQVALTMHWAEDSSFTGDYNTPIWRRDSYDCHCATCCETCCDSCCDTCCDDYDCWDCNCYDCNCRDCNCHDCPPCETCYSFDAFQGGSMSFNPTTHSNGGTITLSESWTEVKRNTAAGDTSPPSSRSFSLSFDIVHPDNPETWMASNGGTGAFGMTDGEIQTDSARKITIGGVWLGVDGAIVFCVCFILVAVVVGIVLICKRKKIKKMAKKAKKAAKKVSKTKDHTSVVAQPLTQNVVVQQVQPQQVQYQPVQFGAYNFQANQVQQIAAQFKNYDLNGDGVIDRNEMTQCLQGTFPMKQPGEIQGMVNGIFQQADKDGTGSINFNEFFAVQSGQQVQQPMMGQQPQMGQPMMGQPMMGQPMMGEPMMGQPMMGQPMMGQPMMQQPQLGTGEVKLEAPQY